MPEEGQEWHCHTCCNQPLDFFTCWIPLADLSADDSRLAVIPGSHTLSGYEQPMSMHGDRELLPNQYTKMYQKEAEWQTPEHIGMGDIILFNFKTIHRANSSKKHTPARLSIDTRVCATPPRPVCTDSEALSDIKATIQRYKAGMAAAGWKQT